ncbi:hypothetical protein V8Z74_25875, partial [Comamonas sp. w2-DMI]
MIADAACAVFFIHPPGFLPHAGEALAIFWRSPSCPPSLAIPPRSALDESAWRAVCKAAAEHAQRGCGLSWEHWVTLFSSEIDAQVSR